MPGRGYISYLLLGLIWVCQPGATLGLSFWSWAEICPEGATLGVGWSFKVGGQVSRVLLGVGGVRKVRTTLGQGNLTRRDQFSQFLQEVGGVCETGAWLALSF